MIQQAKPVNKAKLKKEKQKEVQYLTNEFFSLTQRLKAMSISDPWYGKTWDQRVAVKRKLAELEPTNPIGRMKDHDTQS